MFGILIGQFVNSKLIVLILLKDGIVNQDSRHWSQRIMESDYVGIRVKKLFVKVTDSPYLQSIKNLMVKSYI